MDNPYAPQKDHATYLGEALFTLDTWTDIADLELYVEGWHLILCSVTLSGFNGANAGFRLTTLPPMRKKTDNRMPVHFSIEPFRYSEENLGTWSFHLVAYCRGMVKLQIMLSDGSGSFIWINKINGVNINRAFVHKTICTMSAIPLCGIEEQKNNTTGPQPIGRRAFILRVEEDIKKPVPKNPDKKPPTGGGGTSKL